MHHSNFYVRLCMIYTLINICKKDDSGKKLLTTAAHLVRQEDTKYMRNDWGGAVEKMAL